MRLKSVALFILCVASIIARAQIPVGSNQLDFNLGSTKIHAFTYKAPSYNYGCLIIAFHGDNRHPEWTRDAAIPLADAVGALIIAPDFDVERFGNRLYQGGNVMGQNGMNPPPDWTYAYVPKMIEYVKYLESSPKLPVYLMGHSAGGQFVGRMAAVLDGGSVRYVAANPSAWAFPTTEWRWGYGLGGLDGQ